MKNKLYEDMYSWYKKGYSLQQVGDMFGMTRQSVYIGFNRRAYKLRTIKPLPFLTFNGDKFTLANTGYYRRTDGDRQLMHVVVWKFHNGEVKKGYDIHHKDRNRSNNAISNLEQIRHDIHAGKFATGNNQYSKAKKLPRQN